jgi:Putative phage holin
LPEPTTTAVAMAASAGAATGITLGAMHPDIGLLSGVFCGALVFMLRSTESSRLKKALYFIVSLIGGYASAPAVHERFMSLPMWLAGFVAAAVVVAAVMAILDWIPAGIAKILDRWSDLISGGSSK